MEKGFPVEVCRKQGLSVQHRVHGQPSHPFVSRSDPGLRSGRPRARAKLAHTDLAVLF